MKLRSLCFNFISRSNIESEGLFFIGYHAHISNGVVGVRQNHVTLKNRSMWAKVIHQSMIHYPKLLCLYRQYWSHIKRCVIKQSSRCGLLLFLRSNVKYPATLISYAKRSCSYIKASPGHKAKLLKHRIGNDPTCITAFSRSVSNVPMLQGLVFVTYYLR